MMRRYIDIVESNVFPADQLVQEIGNGDEYVSIDLSVVGPTLVSLEQIWSEQKRRAGHASHWMKKLCDVADRLGVELELVAMPLRYDLSNGGYDDPRGYDTLANLNYEGLDEKQLRAWYEKYGFVFDPGNFAYAKRLPRSKLTEAYDAGRWKRWWANMRTGEIIPVEHQQHDETLFDNLEKFFDEDEIDELMASAHDPWERVDPILLAAYAKGWQAVLYDGNNDSLSLRTGTSFSPTQLVAVARKLAGQYPVNEIIADFEDSDKWVVLKDEALERFLKRGTLPAQP